MLTLYNRTAPPQEALIPYRVISADSHVIEPPDTFAPRVPAKLREKAPRVVSLPDGGECWRVDEEQGTFGLDTAAKFTYKQYRPRGLRFADVARGAWDPKAHVKDMRKDGVDASVLYPGMGFRLYNMKNAEVRVACIRAWNDWLAEFCSHDRARLVGPPLLPTEEETIEMALTELKRTIREHKITTAQMPIFPHRRYYEPFYDPLWDLAQREGISLAIHRGVQRPFAFGGSREGPWMANQVMRDFSYTMPVADLIFGGVFDRFPHLVLVSAEGRTGWLAHFVQRADESFRRHRYWLKLSLKRLPSEYVKANVYSTFIEDRVGIEMRRLIGVDNQMWSSDYPHSDSSWPHSRELNRVQLRGVPMPEKRKLLAENAVRLYRLN
ncbi:MAG: amidohydrolase [Chloroflexi bacterium]|nr:amidohydrolase [Chloroflexota bacterium]